MPVSSTAQNDTEADFDCRIAALEKLKCAIIADITMAKPIRIQAASLGEPDWPAMQLIVALARLADALHLPFELVDAPEALLPRMDDAGIDWRNLNLVLSYSDAQTLLPRNALPIM